MGRLKFLSILGVMALVVLPSTVGANNTVAVSAAAALGGETSTACPSGCGLEITMDGSPNNAHVRESTSHSNETVYTADFKIDMNNVSMQDGDWHMIATWRREDPSAKNAMRLLVRYRQGQANPYKIRIVCRNDDNSWAQPGGHSLPVTGSSDIRIEYQAASSDGASDGFCRFYRNGVLRATAAGLENDGLPLGSATLGVSQVDAGTSGSMYYDSFVAKRVIDP